MPAPISTTRTNGPTPVTTTPVRTLTNARFSTDPQLAQLLSGAAALKSGTKGEGVKRVQQAMIDMGFAQPGSADGSFGPQASKAVRNFQVNASKMFPEVKLTGVVDAATLRALDALALEPGKQGQSKNIPSPKFQGQTVRVVVLKDEHRTFLFDENGKLERIMQNAVGAAATKTDEGLKKVTGKLNEADAIAAGNRLWGGPVFGPRLIDLSWMDGSRSGEELHGTSAPKQLGEDVSHGCVRHSNTDVITLFDRLKRGDRVAIASGLNDARFKATR